VDARRIGSGKERMGDLPMPQGLAGEQPLHLLDRSLHLRLILLLLLVGRHTPLYELPGQALGR